VLFLHSQPIQNAAPLQLAAKDPRIDMLIAYCSLPESNLVQGDEDLTKQAFDIPMLEGYPWIRLKNYSPRPRLGKFYGLINPGVIKLVSRYDCVVVYGHAYLTFWMAIITARLLGKAVILGTDATYIDPHNGGRQWKAALKKKVLPFLYNRVADLVFVPSTASRRFLMSIGVREDQIALTPYVVDNDYIERAAERADRAEIRKEWQVPQDAAVAIFCAKFLERKRPLDAVRAFAKANAPSSYLVMVGDGPLAATLKSEVSRLGITERVRFTGLVKYSRLAELYAASDVLVFPSEHEPYGLPVNEAMICGTPAIVSDRVGAGHDLVEDGRTGFKYPCGDVDALASLLARCLADRKLLDEMGAAARLRMQSWSPRENADATIRGVAKAVRSHQRGQAAGDAAAETLNP
jgi:glycosyltransferase involved in cell wall biosynthesis